MNYGHVLFGRGSGGGCCRIEGVDPSPGTVVGDPELLTVSDTALNGHDGEVLASSLRRGGDVALQLAHRTFRIWEPINVLEIEIVDLEDCDAHGSSADLALGVATYLALARKQNVDLSHLMDFAATGTLDRNGKVDAVDSVAGKLRAALDAGFTAGCILFYPSASQGQVDGDLQATCKARSVELVPVGCIEDVLDKLRVRVERAWEGNPFRGLNAYTAEHGPVFFGREREVEEVVARLEKRLADNKPGLLIIGASGSGKSSFCMAGVMPALQRDTPNLEWAVWRPRDAAKGGSGKEVDEAFFAARLQASTLSQRSGQNGFHLPDPPEGIASLAALADVLVPYPGVRRVLVVDQFEELFTLGFTLDVQRAFARFLQRLQDAGIWVIGTLRSEFYLAYTDLRDEANNALLARVYDQDGRYDLLHMGDEALRRVITGPAHMARLRFEGASGQHATSLDDRILTAALKTSDTLPLLSFILDRLYEDLDTRTKAAAAAGEREERNLAHSAYDAEGGLQGAIGKRAAGAFARLGREAQDALREVLNALAVPSSDGTREMARPALLEQWLEGSPARQLIAALAAPDVRVLITEREIDGLNRPRVRVAHEALFSQWKSAAEVLKDSEQSRAIIEDLRKRADAWNKAGQPNGALLSSLQDLENAKAVVTSELALGVEGTLQAFIGRSICLDDMRHSRVRRIRRIVSIAAGVIILVLSALTVYSQIQRVRAHQSVTRLFAVNGQRALSQNDPILAIRYALSGLTLSASNHSDYRNLLINSIYAIGRNTRIVFQSSSSGSLSFSPSLKYIVQRDDSDGSFSIVSTDAFEITKVLSFKSKLNITAFIPNESGVIVAVGDRAALISIKTGEVKNENITSMGDDFEGWEGPVDISALAVSHNGRFVAVGYSNHDTGVRVWEIGNDKPLFKAMSAHKSAVNTIAFSPSDEIAMSGSSDGKIALWRTKTGKVVTTKTYDDDSISVIAYSPDGRLVAIGTKRGTVDILNIASNHISENVTYDYGEHVRTLAFSPDGKRLLAGGDASILRIWSVASKNESAASFVGCRGGIRAAQFSKTGGHVYANCGDGAVIDWEVSDRPSSTAFLLPVTSALPQGIGSAAYSSDQKQIIISTVSGAIFRFYEESNKIVELVQPPHVAEDYNDIVDDGEQEAFSVLGTSRISKFGKMSVYLSPDIESISFFDHNKNSWGRLKFGEPDNHSWITAVDISEDGKYGVFGTQKSGLGIWNLYKNIPLKQINVAQHVEKDAEGLYPNPWDVGVSAISIANDGSTIATGSKEGRVLLWDNALNLRRDVRFEGQSGTIYSVQFSPDGKLLATGSEDSTIFLWNTRDGTLATPFIRMSQGIVTALSFYGPSKILASGDSNGAIRFWSYENGGSIGSERTVKFDKSSLNSIDYILFGKNERHIYLFNRNSNVFYRIYAPFIFEDTKNIAEYACLKLLGRMGRTFSEEDIRSDILLSTQWGSDRRDVCQG